MNNTKMEEGRFLQSLTFVGVSSADKVTFDAVEPIVILKDIAKMSYDLNNSENLEVIRTMQPIVKLENCEWLQEF